MHICVVLLFHRGRLCTFFYTWRGNSCNNLSNWYLFPFSHSHAPGCHDKFATSASSFVFQLRHLYALNLAHNYVTGYGPRTRSRHVRTNTRRHCSFLARFHAYNVHLVSVTSFISFPSLLSNMYIRFFFMFIVFAAFLYITV